MIEREAAKIDWKQMMGSRAGGRTENEYGTIWVTTLETTERKGGWVKTERHKEAERKKIARNGTEDIPIRYEIVVQFEKEGKHWRGGGG